MDLKKVYTVGTVSFAALNGVSVSIRRGEFVAIVGPSGSGKTTLLNLIGTLDVPTSGEIFLDGTPTARLKGNALASLRNKTLSFVFQFFNLVPYLTASENVSLPMLAAGVGSQERLERSKALLGELGLQDMVNKKPRALSGGEQQRVAIARSLVNNPSIILADEPTGNLDSHSSEVVMSILKGVSERRRVTIIMVTHNLELTTYCHRTIHFRDGRVEKEVVTPW